MKSLTEALEQARMRPDLDDFEKRDLCRDLLSIYRPDMNGIVTLGDPAMSKKTKPKRPPKGYRR